MPNDFELAVGLDSVDTVDAYEDLDGDSIENVSAPTLANSGHPRLRGSHGCPELVFPRKACQGLSYIPTNQSQHRPSQPERRLLLP